MIIKIIIIAIETIIIGVLLSLEGNVEKEVEYSTEEYEQAIFQTNSYYTDVNIEPERIHRENSIKTWTEYLYKEDINNAFKMLTDDCRSSLFDNDIDIFESQFVDKLGSEHFNAISFEQISERYENEIGYIEYTLDINGENVNILIEDRGPFNQKIELK